MQVTFTLPALFFISWCCTIFSVLFTWVNSIKENTITQIEIEQREDCHQIGFVKLKHDTVAAPYGVATISCTRCTYVQPCCNTPFLPIILSPASRSLTVAAIPTSQLHSCLIPSDICPALSKPLLLVPPLSALSFLRFFSLSPNGVIFIIMCSLLAFYRPFPLWCTALERVENCASIQ